MNIFCHIFFLILLISFSIDEHESLITFQRLTWEKLLGANETYLDIFLHFKDSIYQFLFRSRGKLLQLSLWNTHFIFIFKANSFFESHFYPDQRVKISIIWNLDIKQWTKFSSVAIFTSTSAYFQVLKIMITSVISLLDKFWTLKHYTLQ